MMEFLYFPEDKTEYIPAFIMLVIFMIGATLAMLYFYKKSKKEEKFFENKYFNQEDEEQLWETYSNQNSKNKNTNNEETKK